MIDLKTHGLVHRPVRMRNSAAELMTVWLEPWAEQIELARGDRLEIDFVGPEPDQPEIEITAQGAISVYGWEGSEAIAFKNGRVVGERRTVEEIIRTELELAKVILRPNPELGGEISALQHALDATSELDAESQYDACKWVALFVDELATSLPKFVPAIDLLWQIASQLLRIKGVMLIEPNSTAEKTAIMNKVSKQQAQSLVDCAFFGRSRNFAAIEPKSAPRTKRRSAD